jgi:biopolymer transport protein ExbB
MDLLFIIALVVTSIISVTFMVERGLALRWRKVIPAQVEAGVIQFRNGGDLPRLRAICEANLSPISRLLIFAAEHLDWPKNENADVLQTRARHEVTRLERGLVVLEIIVGIAPLMGLVGTIYGLILLFGGMGEISTDQTGTFAQGISLALNATLLGLLIAIPTLVAWSYLSKKVENLAVEMESLCDEFLRKNYHSVWADARAADRAMAEPAMVSVTDPSPPLHNPAVASPEAGSKTASPAVARPARIVRRTAQA